MTPNTYRYGARNKFWMLLGFAIAMALAMLLGGCTPPPEDPEFEFVCSQDGRETKRMLVSFVRMTYDPKRQAEVWTVAVGTNHSGGSYTFQAARDEVCGPVLPPPPDVD